MLKLGFEAGKSVKSRVVQTDLIAKPVAKPSLPTVEVVEIKPTFRKKHLQGVATIRIYEMTIIGWSIIRLDDGLIIGHPQVTWIDGNGRHCHETLCRPSPSLKKTIDQAILEKWSSLNLQDEITQIT